jgi:hypothetical protein
VWSLGRRLRRWYRECTIHVPQKKGRYDTKTPGSEKLKKKV